jgi:outer membrane receptor protein involved in Fe transport
VRGVSAGLGQLSFDGVPLYSSVNGFFNLSTVPVDALGRIEIVRGTSSETVGGALRGAKAWTTVTARRDDVFEDISQADSRNGNPERDGFRTTQGVARLTLAPTARLTLESSALLRIICVRL